MSEVKTVDMDYNRDDFKIYKYELMTQDNQILELPGLQKVLKVGFQGNKLIVWALVNHVKKNKNYKFYIIGTGHAVPKDIKMCTFIDTVFIDWMVFHIFYRPVV